jgi:hypothetical protein
MSNFSVSGALAVAAVALAAASAPAATEHGITPLSPKPGATIPAGKRALFRARVAAADGAVWVYVCRTAVRDDDGVICGATARSYAVRKANRIAEYRPRPNGAAGAWLRTPGTYYWQVFRVDCEDTPRDCKKEGPVRRVVVR